MRLVFDAFQLLAFGFMGPGFVLAGSLLIAVPIIIHILNRRRFKTMQWAAMEFLLRAMKKNRRRLRFEQLLLLATRCLLLFLLGLALARPMGCQNSALAVLGRRTSLNVFIIDNSYSMGFEARRPRARTHLDQAKLVAKALLDRPSAGGVSVAVISAAKPAAAVIAKPGFDLAAAKSAIDRIEQSYTSTDLAGAMELALRLAKDEPNQPNKNLVLLTDSTRSAWESEQSPAIKQSAAELAKYFKVSHYDMSDGRQQWNGAIFDIAPTDNLVTTQFDTQFVAKVRAFGTSHEARLQWKLDDQAVGAVPVVVRSEAASEDQTSGQVKVRTGGPHVVSATLLNDDSLQVDNTRFRVIEVASQLRALIVEGKRGISPLEGSGAYLQHALAPPRESEPGKPVQSSSYVAPDLISDLELANKLLTDYRAVILAGVGQISDNEAERLKHFVEQGGTLMLFMGDAVNKDNYNATLLPRHLLPGPLVKLMSVGGTDRRGFLLDFKPNAVLHPLLRDFANQENTGLDTAEIFTYWQADVPSGSNVDRVLNYLLPENRSGRADPKAGAPDPAITVHTLGQGRVVFVSTTASPDWTNFPVKPNYLSLMLSLVSNTVRTGDYWMNLTAGQPLVIPATVRLASAPSMVDAGQRQIAIDPLPEQGATVYRTAPLTKPGLYMLSLGDRNVPVAVNVPATDEADVRTITQQQLRDDLGGIEVAFHGADVPAEAAMASEGNDLSWWCMIAVLSLVGVECFMAMRFGHYRRTDMANQKS